MTYGAFTQDFAPYECVVRSRSPLPQVALCALALVSTTGVGLWALYARHAASVSQAAQATPQVAQVAAAAPAPTNPVFRTAAIAPLRAAAHKTEPKIAALAIEATPEKVRGLLDPNLTSSYGAVVFARNAALRSGGETRPAQSPVIARPVQAAAVPQVVPAAAPVSPVQVAAISPAAQGAPALPRVALSEPVAEPVVEDIEVPLPLPRPASLATRTAPATAPVQRRVAPQMADVGGVTAPEDKPTFFDKLFSRPKETGPLLAYAAPEDGMIGNVLRDTVGRPAAVDRYTAVYNITTHTVTLPDGTRLEAHSGLGAAKDNPRMVTQRMVGATPPNVYDLTLREAPFHGVRALRLTPTGGTTFGRAGLLAHTYMLRGRSGESNGCVVFRDYEAFLRAYESGSIRRLAVVAGG